MKNIAGLFLGVCVLFSNILFATEFQINTRVTGDQIFRDDNQVCTVVASDGTNYLVTWGSSGQDGSDYGVYGQIVSSSGELMGDEFRVNTYTAGNQINPTVGSDGTNYLVTWRSSGQDGSDYGVFGQVVSSSGALVGDEFRVNTYTTSYQQMPTIGSDGTNYLVTWRGYQQDGSNFGVYGQMVNSSGELVGDEFRVNTYTASDQGNPTVASDGNNYLVAWQSFGQDGGSYGLYGQMVNSSGELVGDEFRVNTYTASEQYFSSVASDGTNYFVTWTSSGQDGSGYGLYGQMVNSSGLLVGDEFQINTYTTNSQMYSSIAFDGINYLVTWQSNGQDGSGYGVYGQFIDSLGLLVGDEFLINTYTTNDQAYSSVASDGTDYLVAWQSNGQDGSGWGVYGDIIAGTQKPDIIPEPSTMVLLISTGLGLFIRRKK